MVFSSQLGKALSKTPFKNAKSNLGSAYVFHERCESQGKMESYWMALVFSFFEPLKSILL
jgi:hypothetical protein